MVGTIDRVGTNQHVVCCLSVHFLELHPSGEHCCILDAALWSYRSSFDVVHGTSVGVFSGVALRGDLPANVEPYGSRQSLPLRLPMRALVHGVPRTIVPNLTARARLYYPHHVMELSKDVHAFITHAVATVS